MVKDGQSPEAEWKPNPVPCSIPEGWKLTGFHVNSNILIVLDWVGGEVNPLCNSEHLSLNLFG